MTTPDLPATCTAQERFDERYITSAEICRELGVNRTTVLAAKKKGLLPDAVMVGDVLCIWERAAVRPNIDAWKRMLDVRRRRTDGSPGTPWLNNAVQAHAHST
jgi:predicted DNA-binding transcriptional regulator AlpA